MSELDELRARIAAIETGATVAGAERDWTYVVCEGCTCPHDHGGSTAGPSKVACPTDGCPDKGSARTETMRIPVGSQGPILVRSSAADAAAAYAREDAAAELARVRTEVAELRRLIQPPRSWPDRPPTSPDRPPTP